jgi:hypothetical protein
VIGFHHWVGRETVQIDNEREFFRIVAPYNVRLLLIGHGHSDITWNANGIPAVMARGLYQGSYHLIQVSRDRLRVLRRTAEAPTPTAEVLSVPLQRPPAPTFGADSRFTNGRGRITVTRGTLPADARLAFRVNAGSYQPLQPDPATGGWQGEVGSAGLIPGEHSVTVQATLPDGRAYQLPVPVSLRGSGGGLAQAPVWTAGSAAPCRDRSFARPAAATGCSCRPWPATSLRWTRRAGANSGGCAPTARSFSPRTWMPGPCTPPRGTATSTPPILRPAGCAGARRSARPCMPASPRRRTWCACPARQQDFRAGYAQRPRCLDRAGSGLFQSKAATDGTRFYVGGWDNFVRALDCSHGRELWKRQLGKNARSGAFQFYFRARYQFARRSAAGACTCRPTTACFMRWTRTRATSCGKRRICALGYSSPRLDDERIFSASLTEDPKEGIGRVFRFNARTGAAEWDTPTGSVIYDSSPALGGGNVFVSGVDGRFSALDADDGALRWQYRLPPGHVFSSPATDNSRVYIGSMNGTVTAFPLDVNTPRSARTARERRADETDRP